MRNSQTLLPRWGCGRQFCVTLINGWKVWSVLLEELEMDTIYNSGLSIDHLITCDVCYTFDVAEIWVFCVCSNIQHMASCSEFCPHVGIVVWSHFRFAHPVIQQWSERSPGVIAVCLIVIQQQLAKATTLAPTIQLKNGSMRTSPLGTQPDLIITTLCTGSISDRELAERCGILDLLEPGDVCMSASAL